MLVDRPLTATPSSTETVSTGAGRTQKAARDRQSGGGAQFGGVRMPRTNVLRLKMLQLGVDREPLLGGHRGGRVLATQPPAIDSERLSAKGYFSGPHSFDNISGTHRHQRDRLGLDDIGS